MRGVSRPEEAPGITKPTTGVLVVGHVSGVVGKRSLCSECLLMQTESEDKVERRAGGTSRGRRRAEARWAQLRINICRRRERAGWLLSPVSGRCGVVFQVASEGLQALSAQRRLARLIEAGPVLKLLEMLLLHTGLSFMELGCLRLACLVRVGSDCRARRYLLAATRREHAPSYDRKRKRRQEAPNQTDASLISAHFSGEGARDARLSGKE